jgi:acetoin utilization protein AcuB
MEHGFTTIQPRIAAAHIDPSLKVTRWMSKTVFATRPDSKLIDAIELMTDHRIRHVPVIDGDRLVGIISDRDVRNALPRRSEVHGAVSPICHASLVRRASEVMTKHPLTIPKDFSIHEAAEIMCREKIGALPVMDDGHVIGIISSEDLLWALMQITGEAQGGER